MKRVLKLLYKIGVTFKLNICKCLVKTIYYVSKVVRLGRLDFSEVTTDTVPKLKHHTTQIRLLSFVGPRNIFCGLIQILLPLGALHNQNLTRDQPKHLSPHDEKGMAEVLSLKQSLISTTLLALRKK